MNRIPAAALGFLVVGLSGIALGANEGGVSLPGPARNVIFMVPDGMGLADVTAARILKNGPDGAPLNLETLRTIGYQRTHSANSTVTDSAAAASAWAAGDKFNNGEISCHSVDTVCVENPPTILELAKAEGGVTCCCLLFEE